MCNFNVEMFRSVPSSQAMPLPSSAITVAGGPRVLLVEDDPRQQALLSQLLTDAGYDVTVADNAMVALGELSGHVDLLITDVDLDSRLTGLDIARLAHAVKPDLPVLVLSARPPAEAEGLAHLRKPCTSGAVLTAVRRLAPVQ